MEKEFAQLHKLLSDTTVERHHNKGLVSSIFQFTFGRVGNNEIIMQQCGIGKINSAVGTAEMIARYQPDFIISTGCAGGADTRLNIADVVVSTECTYHDAYCGSNCAMGQIMGMPERYASPLELIDKATSLDCETNIHKGLIVSGEWFVDTREKMQSILNNFPEAAAVDMESCSIAQTCHLYNTPFLSFRIISDIPLKDTNATQYFDFWERMANSSFQVTKHFLENL